MVRSVYSSVGGSSAFVLSMSAVSRMASKLSSSANPGLTHTVPHVSRALAKTRICATSCVPQLRKHLVDIACELGTWVPHKGKGRWLRRDSPRANTQQRGRGGRRAGPGWRPGPRGGSPPGRPKNGPPLPRAGLHAFAATDSAPHPPTPRARGPPHPGQWDVLPNFPHRRVEPSTAPHGVVPLPGAGPPPAGGTAASCNAGRG